MTLGRWFIGAAIIWAMFTVGLAVIAHYADAERARRWPTVPVERPDEPLWHAPVRFAGAGAIVLFGAATWIYADIDQPWFATLSGLAAIVGFIVAISYRQRN